MVQLNEEMTPAPKPRPLRLAFRKTGVLQYISHLDLQRTMARAIIRAHIPVWYTEGFNPKPRLVFSTPLSVGCESICELMDFRIVASPQNDEAAELQGYLASLCAVLPNELAPHALYVPERKFADIAYASYDIRFATRSISLSRPSIDAVLKSTPLIVTKRTGKTEKESDISSLISDLSVLEEGEDTVIRTVLSASSSAYLNPEYIVRALENAHAFTVSQGMLEYALLRTALLDSEKHCFS